MSEHPAPIGDHELARRKQVQARAAERVTTIVDEQIARLHADTEHRRAAQREWDDAMERGCRHLSVLLLALSAFFAAAVVAAHHFLGGIL